MGLDLKKICGDSKVQVAFALVVLVVLFLVLAKEYGWFSAKDESTERMEQRQMGVYYGGSGPANKVTHSVPYLENDIVYVTEMQAQARREQEDKARNAAAEAAQDALAVNASNAGSGDVAGVERMTASRGYPSVTGIERRFIAPTEKMVSNREGPMTWLVGDDIAEMKHEVSGQSPDLATNRWTMQLQNQVSDLRSDTIEGQLWEDTLFQANLANM